MTLDLALPVQLLWRRKVIGVWVDEEAGLHSLDRKLDIDVRVGRDRIEISGADEFSRGDVRRRRDHTHRRGIARSACDLLAVRDGRIGDRQAKVDEVVGRSQRGDLSCLATLTSLTVARKTLRNDSRVKGLHHAQCEMKDER